MALECGRGRLAELPDFVEPQIRERLNSEKAYNPRRQLAQDDNRNTVILQGLDDVVGKQAPGSRRVCILVATLDMCNFHTLWRTLGGLIFVGYLSFLARGSSGPVGWGSSSDP